MKYSNLITLVKIKKIICFLIVSLFFLNLFLDTATSESDRTYLTAEIVGDLHCETQYPCKCSVMTNFIFYEDIYENVELIFHCCDFNEPLRSEFFHICMRKEYYVECDDVSGIPEVISDNDRIEILWPAFGSPIYINKEQFNSREGVPIAVCGDVLYSTDIFETYLGDFGEYHISIYDNDYKNLDTPIVIEVEYKGQRYVKEFEKPKSSSYPESMKYFEMNFEGVYIKLLIEYMSATFGNMREWTSTYFYAYLHDYFPSETTPPPTTPPKPTTTPPPTTPKPTTLPPTTTPVPTTPSPTTPKPTTLTPTTTLTPEKKMELAEEYAPTLYFYKSRIWGEEEFFLIEAEYFINISDPNKQYDIPGVGYMNALQYQEGYNGKRNPVYVNVVIDEYKGKKYLVIQYWFHYLYNRRQGFNHEGEWEMIEVILEYDDSILREDKFPDPYAVAYSQHHWGETHKWNNSIIQKNEHHPVIYVAWGSHASYFDESTSILVDHDVRNKGTKLEYKNLNLELLDNKEWLDFSSKWGGDPLSPKGPMFTEGYPPLDISKWDQPVRFAMLGMSSTEITLGSPAHLLITNQKDQRIGYKREEFVNEIPGAYPIITEDHEYYHLPNDMYSVEITAFEDGDIDLSIRINDNGEVTYIAYENKQVTEKTKAYTTLDPSKKDYEIEMDKDGDGIIDETIKPDKIITYKDEEPETKTPTPTTSPSPDTKILFLGIIIAIIITLVVLVFSRGRSQQPTEIPIVRERPSIERTTVRWIPKRETDRGTRIAKKPKKEATRRERIEAVAQEIPLLEVHKAKKTDAGKNIVRIDKKTREKLGIEKGDFVYIVGEKKAKARVDTAYKEDTGKNIIRINKKLREKAGVNFKDKIKIEKVDDDEE